MSSWLKYTFVSALGLGLLACNDVQSTISQPDIRQPGNRTANSLGIAPPASMRRGGKSHFKKRVREIAQQRPLDGGVLFVGDSITEGGDWAGLFPSVPTANHGVGWDTIDGVKARLPQIILNNPDKIFIMIGTNDIGYNSEAADMAAKLEGVIQGLRSSRPEAELFLQSVLPREESKIGIVAPINMEFAKLATDKNITFINLTSNFSDPKGRLRAELTNDGLHLNSAGYAVWAEAIRSSVVN